jgi:hypothetical protein
MMLRHVDWYRVTEVFKILGVYVYGLVRFYEISVNVCESKRRNITEELNISPHCSEHLRSGKLYE